MVSSFCIYNSCSGHLYLFMLPLLMLILAKMYLVLPVPRFVLHCSFTLTNTLIPAYLLVGVREVFASQDNSQIIDKPGD